MSKIPDSLVLNASYEPHCVINWQRATIFILFDIAEAAEIGVTPTHEINSPSITVEVPHVLRLITMVDTHRFKSPKLPAKQLILQRDNHLCQYCIQMQDPRTKQRFREKATTVDHVIPQSRGGKSTWDNMVACCYQCNQYKTDHTVEECGWKKPKATIPDERLITPAHPSWEKWLNQKKISL